MVSVNQQPSSMPQPPLPEDLIFTELMTLLQAQERTAEQLQAVTETYLYARQKHEGQIRKNGENYITHPVAVALMLAQMEMDTPTVQAALLHDVLEDTDAKPEEIKARFGSVVLKIVEGVTKLGKYKFSSTEERQAENFRKMFLAMADDGRVIILKLTDRLHNMRTLDFLKPEKQRRIAQETLEIFAPLANWASMGNFRAELEDLSLQYLYPEAYQQIRQELEATRQERDQTMAMIKEKIQSQLAQMGIHTAKIYGRVKNYYSIFKKMQRQDKGLNDIYDISALRVIVPQEHECYQVLGIIHNAFRPIPGRFKDYIAIPKNNDYRSLHTTMIGPAGRPVEVQIRTWDMHRQAEEGIASHWKYKSSGSVSTSDREAELITNLRKRIEAARESTDSAKDCVDSITDLFTDEVYVLTPKGQVLDLPKGSTPVDFAYRIHTEVGHACSGALVNGKLVPLSYLLSTGDFVEIITNKKSTPRLDWINFVKTNQAKGRIRQWFKKNFREAHEQQGRQLLEAELTRAKVDEWVRNGRLLAVAQELNYSNLEDMFMALGYGELTLSRITNRLRRAELLADQSHRQEQRLKIPPAGAHASHSAAKAEQSIEGLKGLLYSLARCCTPVPGDPIVGVVTRSRGVMIHREDCGNLVNANPNRLMVVSWEGDVDMNSTHRVTLELLVIDRMGVLKDVLTQIADARTNLSGARVKQTNTDHTVVIEVVIDIRDLDHLESVKRAILSVSDVLSVKRQHYRPNRS
ncbi:MAG: bifunctional (p)ppGpp synthetase/guanosine-3',5'-bis(diphosphate) 3'-pyrophosphohydrolase [Candidatus Melainabacteria bacterium]|nr:bifunctional (p)ppGpp synthetase/guanosine-3',5'-bis(diphosphate) 3'-pyrophosphohydrolase [Candidatus Melainabacteria bacterium]